MNVAPQLTAEEFKDIHNGKCELNGVLQSLEGVVHPKLQERFEKAVALINKGLKNAYKLDNEAYEKKMSHYDAISEANGFKSIWSVHKVTNLNTPFAGAATHVLYKDHWGKKEVKIPINGNTWVDLWVAADAAIAQSGDTHHMFIEAFIPGKDGVLVLSTGS